MDPAAEVVKKKLESTLCVICGVNPPTTGQGDHIPPKSLYTRGERSSVRWQFHTVPACQQCNVGGSADDEALKLAIGIETGELRGSPDEMIESLAATIGKNRRLADQVFRTRQNVEVRDASGSTKSMVRVEFDIGSYTKSIGRQARGLYWRITGRILHPRSTVRILPSSPLTDELKANIEEVFAQAPVTKLNGGTFRCQLVPQGDAELMRLEYFGKHKAYAVIRHMDPPE